MAGTTTPKLKGRAGLIAAGIAGAAGLLGVALWDKDDGVFTKGKQGIESFLSGWFGKNADPNKEIGNARLHVVNFDYDSARITSGQTGAVAGTLGYLARNPDDGIIIVGCADRIGKEAHNKGLAQKRAEAVSTVFQAAGIPKERIGITQGLGEHCPVPETDGDVNEKKRAAVIFSWGILRPTR